MSPIYSIGIQSLWDELRHMPTGGIWWVNTDREHDALTLMNQTLLMQQKEAKVAVASMDQDLRNLIKLDTDHGPDKIRLFSMPAHNNSLYFFTRDLLSSLNPEKYLVILLCANNAWQNIPTPKLHEWLEKAHSWVKYYDCTLLVINPGTNIDKQLSILMSEYRALLGLASLRYQSDMHLYDVAWWCNEKGVSARQQLALHYHQDQWQLAQQEEASVQPRSDEKQILSNIAVLEGAPPLSEYWTLFDTNEALFEEARASQAATLIFTLEQNNQIEGIARQVHTLRRQRGSSLKIVVRETQASLRATDERLLLGCGANIVVPWNASLSRCLTLIETIQGQQFNRLVPEDIATLLSMTQPLKLRGYQPWEKFCDAVSNMINNQLLPADGKGVLVALRPVPGIRVEQALTLCRPNRMGDIVTMGDNRLVLFLSFCRVNDLDIALNHIFPLPMSDIFSNRTVWFEDKQIAAELIPMRTLPLEKREKPLKVHKETKKTINATHDGTVWRRVPEPCRLFSETPERSS
ncbi:cellulose biosynthesis c-di-GMP-binding protein BcsE [Salmonella enterica]